MLQKDVVAVVDHMVALLYWKHVRGLFNLDDYCRAGLLPSGHSSDVMGSWFYSTQISRSSVNLLLGTGLMSDLKLIRPEDSSGLLRVQTQSQNSVFESDYHHTHSTCKTSTEYTFKSILWYLGSLEKWSKHTLHSPTWSRSVEFGHRKHNACVSSVQFYDVGCETGLSTWHQMFSLASLWGWIS